MGYYGGLKPTIHPSVIPSFRLKTRKHYCTWAVPPHRLHSKDMCMCVCCVCLCVEGGFTTKPLVRDCPKTILESTVPRFQAENFQANLQNFYANLKCNQSCCEHGTESAEKAYFRDEKVSFR